MSKTLEELAATCAKGLPPSPRSFHEDRAALTAPLDELVAKLRQHDARFDFDLAGRPHALTAVRHALPAMEADLLDAILDDVACELAAYQEALYRVALAARHAGNT